MLISRRYKPASEAESVSFAFVRLLRRLIDPLERNQTGFVVVLDLVEDGARVASLGDEGQVVQQVRKSGVRPEK